MKTLDEIAKAVVAIFPQPEMAGVELDTHRVETQEKNGKLDVVIVHKFPPPAKRFELTIERTAKGWLAAPKSPEHGFMAQAVAMRLQRNAVGNSGPANTSEKTETGYAVTFVTELPTEETPAPKAKRANVEASV